MTSPKALPNRCAQIFACRVVPRAPSRSHSSWSPCSARMLRPGPTRRPPGWSPAMSSTRRAGPRPPTSSGNGLTATLSGGPTWGPGHTGNALTFNGSSSYATVSGFPALPNWTITLSVRSPAAPSNAGNSGPVQRQTNFAINWNHQQGSFRGAATVRVGNTHVRARSSPRSRPTPGTSSPPPTTARPCARTPTAPSAAPTPRPPVLPAAIPTP